MGLTLRDDHRDNLHPSERDDGGDHGNTPTPAIPLLPRDDIPP